MEEEEEDDVMRRESRLPLGESGGAREVLEETEGGQRARTGSPVEREER